MRTAFSMPKVMSWLPVPIISCGMNAFGCNRPCLKVPPHNLTKATPCDRDLPVCDAVCGDGYPARHTGHALLPGPFQLVKLSVRLTVPPRHAMLATEDFYFLLLPEFSS